MTKADHCISELKAIARESSEPMIRAAINRWIDAYVHRASVAVNIEASHWASSPEGIERAKHVAKQDLCSMVSAVAAVEVVPGPWGEGSRVEASVMVIGRPNN